MHENAHKVVFNTAHYVSIFATGHTTLCDVDVVMFDTSLTLVLVKICPSRAKSAPRSLRRALLIFFNATGQIPGHSIAAVRELKSSPWATAGGKGGLKSAQNDSCLAGGEKAPRGVAKARTLAAAARGGVCKAVARDLSTHGASEFMDLRCRQHISLGAQFSHYEVCPLSVLGSWVGRTAPVPPFLNSSPRPHPVGFNINNNNNWRGRARVSTRILGLTIASSTQKL